MQSRSSISKLGVNYLFTHTQLIVLISIANSIILIHRNIRYKQKLGKIIESPLLKTLIKII